MVKLSFQDSPTKREATAHPPNFPTTATVINNRHTHHNSGVLINPICVRNPVKAKITVEKNQCYILNLLHHYLTETKIRRHDYTRHKSTKQSMNPQNFRNSRRYNQNQNIKLTKVLFITSLLE